MKNKGTAIVIAIFFGGIGIHQFYLGNTTRAVLMLLFAWTFVPAIIAFIDIIILISISDKAFNEQYNVLQ